MEKFIYTRDLKLWLDPFSGERCFLFFKGPVPPRVDTRIDKVIAYPTSKTRGVEDGFGPGVCLYYSDFEFPSYSLHLRK